MKIKTKDLQEKVVAGVKKLGYTGDDAQAIVDTLLYAEMRGNNQGITKIATGGIPKASDVEKLRVAKENKCGVLLSGGHSMIASVKAADMAVGLAEKYGVGVVAVNHTFSSSGAIGFFSRRIARNGYIGFVCVGNGSFKFVAPTGSAEPKLGTNPLSYAFPYNGGEVVFDAATSAIAYFGFVEAKLKGEEVAQGIAFDKEGNPSTDAKEILDDGSVSTFGEHKGFGLSLFVQLLGSAFSLAGSPNVNEEDGSGTFVMAIDPGLLAGKDEFMERSTALIEQIKTAEPVDGESVYLPGEQGDAIMEQAEQSGKIEIADAIWQELCDFVGE